MNKKQYETMDWPQIETICYAESDNPHAFLGTTVLEHETRIQTFYPDAVKMFVVLKNGRSKREIEMEKVDEAGFFTCFLEGTDKKEYSYKAILEEGEIHRFQEVYNAQQVISKEELKKFQAGVNYKIYDYLGAHPCTVDGKKGVLFAVWAPNALRVSVVGDFNDWDGRVHMMRRLQDSGVFELFIPEDVEGMNYKYELMIHGGVTFMKADPYGNAAQLRPETASVVTDIGEFVWEDSEWIDQRKQGNLSENPFNIYEVHLGSFMKPEDGREFCNYRELSERLIPYIKEMHYTHIEIMPVMEHPLDQSWGYQTLGYYAPTARFGTPEDFMYFMNEMHKAGIGVILDWVPSHFPRDVQGLSNFDGTCLYEHLDPKKSYHPLWGTLNYNYGRPEVSNYLIANALFWVEKYHADGIRMDAVSSMLYLDYGKAPGQWYPNLYGGNENLEAVEFVKHLNSVMHKLYPGVCMIAEESAAWPGVTTDLSDDGLGFDFKWNLGWMNDYLRYICFDPYFRKDHHNELTFSMLYAYSEKFILEFSHDEVVHGKCSLLGKMPGNMDEKFANLRLSLGFMMVHPGKKLLFMGQELAEEDEWNETRSIHWELSKIERHKQMQDFVKALNTFYEDHPALYEQDYDADGFEWINNINAEENLLVFIRRAKKAEETLLIIANFANAPRNNYQIGVPYEGKYKEVFSTDYEKFGGAQYINSRTKQAKEEECDYRDYSIQIKIPPLSISVFQYMEKNIISLEDEKRRRKIKKHGNR